MKRISLVLSLLVALAGAASAQVVYIDNNNPATGTVNTFPWGQTGGFTTLHVYNASQLTAGGVGAGAVLTDIAVAPANGTSGTYSAPQARLSIGHLVTSPPIAGGWESNLASPSVAHDLTSGPYTFPWTINTWTSLPGVTGAGFVWNGVSDIGIFYTSSPGVTGAFYAYRTPTNLRHAVAIFNATNQAPTSNGLFAMKVRLTFVQGPPTYQTNGPGASLDVNGLQSSGYAGAASNHCIGSPITVNLNGLVGNGWELLVSNSPLVPAGGGAVVTGNGQVVNVNLADPSTGFLWSLSFPPFPAPLGGSAPLAIPLGMPAVPLIAAQMAILDGSHPDGFRLSQAIQMNGVPAASSAPGPVGDDVALTITAGQPVNGVTCFIAPALPLYGVYQNTYHVITNGRITWPTADVSYTPSTGAAQVGVGMVGCWSDLNTLTAGNISLSMAGNAFVASWNGVGYFGGTVANVNTFSIAIDTVTGVVTITGTSAIAVQAGLNMFIGASPGTAATDPGMAAFGPAGAGAATLTTDMIYRFGPTGPTLAAGANTIVLTPDGFGNYTWASS